MLHLLGAEAKHPTGKPMHGLLLAVDRFALDDKGAQQHTQCACMRYGAPRIALDVLANHLFQADTFDEVIDQGQGP